MDKSRINTNWKIINPDKKRESAFIRGLLFVLLAVTLISSVLISENAYAQIDHPYAVDKLPDIGNNRDFVVGPGKIELKINPGENQTYNITVANRMLETKIFRIEVEDFRGSNNPEQTVVLLGDQRGPYSLKDYISLAAYEFTLQSGDKATIPVNISIPADEEPGGRYGSVIISTVSSKASTKTSNAGTAIVTRIGALFFITVPGGAEESGILKDFRTKAGKKIFSQNKIPFEILFENTGTIHLNPYGEIRIRNWLGKEVGEILIDSWFAMPDSLRFREVSWERPYLIGIYTAEAFINRGYEDIIDTDNFTFFVIPWKTISIAILAIILLILLIRFLFKRFEFRRKT